MNVLVYAAACVTPEQVQALSQKPEHRKATRHSLLALQAFEQVLDPLKLEFEKAPERFGIFVASSHGALEVTQEFLSELAQTGTGRPFLFQNSLHHSTLGYLTLKNQFTGFAFTSSAGSCSGESAIDLALGYLQAGKISYAMVIGVESIGPTLLPVMAKNLPETFRLKDGAGAIAIGTAPRGALASGFAMVREKGGTISLPTDYYDADAPEVLARALAEGQSCATRITPDGHLTRFTWKR